MKIDPDYFEDWRQHPLTVLLLQRCVEWASDKQEQWVALSWQAGSCDPTALARLREAAMTLEQIASVTRDQLEGDEA